MDTLIQSGDHLALWTFVMVAATANKEYKYVVY